MNILSRLFGGGSETEAAARISRQFEKLGKHQTGLNKDVAAYVANGTGGAVLSTLSMRSLQQHWQSTGMYWPGSHNYTNLFKAGVDWSDEQLARLGDVIAALHPLAGQSWGLMGTPKSPDWLRHAVIVRAVRDRTVCDVEALARLAALRDLGSDIVADIVFGPNPTQYGTDNCVDLFGGTERWLKAQADDILAAAPKMAAIPRAQLMAAIGRFGLTEPYLELLMDGAVSSSKTVKEAAQIALTKGSTISLPEALRHRFSASAPGVRAELVTFAARALGEAAAPILRDWLADESAPKVRLALENALGGLHAAAHGGTDDKDDSYLALDGSTVAIPPMPSVPDAPPLSDAVISLLRPSMDSFNAVLDKARREGAKERWHWSKQFNSVGSETLRAIRDAAEGKNDGKKGRPSEPKNFQWMQIPASFDRSGIEAFLSSPSLTLRHIVNLYTWSCHGNLFWAFSPYITGPIAAELRRRIAGGADLRVLRAMWRDEDAVVEHLTRRWGSSVENIDSERLWPLVTRYFDHLEEALGFRPQSGKEPMIVSPALELLATLPKVPQRFLMPLLTVATGTRKGPRAEARRLLAGAPGIDGLITRMLEDGKQEVRAGAAEWLTQRGVVAAIPALRKTLTSEKSDVARAALITALERLGDDVSDVFDPLKMKKEAEAGLIKAQPKGLEWFPFDVLPTLNWRDGTMVDPILVRWWIVLAARLKQTSGNALMDLWLDRLAPGHAHRLGLHVLSAWIAQDTRTCTLDEANAYAESVVDTTLKQNLQYVKQYPQSASYWITDRDKLFAQIRKDKLNTYLGSAVDSKGLLGLTTRVDGADMAKLCRAFLKNHGSRVSQAKAILDALAANPSPAAIQIVLATANRFKAKTVQAHAATLIEEIAARRGWTTEELADRTIPTAGLDETGTAELECGNDRAYRMVLDASDALVLLNGAGQPVKALPTARNDEEKPLIEEAKKALATARKELKQVIPDQTARLREAMCLERIWPVEDWQLYVMGHPLVARLARRLVWMGLDDDGRCVATFRPLDDNSLSDSDDGAVDVARFASVQLAHSQLVEARLIEGWQTHLADYEVISPFDQFGRDLPVFDPAHKADTVITDRRGWMIETFKLRGAANKLGYTRGAAEDGGVFFTYERTYNAAGLVALIHFSGSPLPEENLPAALTELSFAKLRRNSGWHGASVALGEVPPVLLAETRQDLHDIAAKGTGFEADWEKKTPW
ncbi:DUF4132 domain-containing protein [Asticcacaulis sp. YBE204]|uniref:DUF4132 domain-containing protein n=1 Tax=Asticcacaulis sp. YBE204 TaxID=1282363 RepID=UPI0004192C53|nr:DUF4132 domain-containing protein [Asticcacaulis sp. YBE204]